MAAATIWVGTRKGLFTVRKGASGWAPGAPRFPGEPVSQIAHDAKTGECYAALRLGHFGVKVWKGREHSEQQRRPADGRMVVTRTRTRTRDA